MGRISKFHLALLLCFIICLLLAVGCVRRSSTPQPTAMVPATSTAPVQIHLPTVTPTSTVETLPSPSPTPVCVARHGQVESSAYPGFVLPEQIPVRVYLPPCYDEEDRDYPVLYLLHGYPYDESHWDDLGADELVDGKIGSGAWPPFLVVMARQPEPLFTSSDGGPGSYEAELVEGLIPYIDHTYRTEAKSDSRALAGISRGGVWALEVAFRHPDMFNTVAALSPALHVNYARPAYDPFYILRQEEPLPRHIFLSAGDQEPAFLSKIEKLSQALTEVGVDHTFVIGVGRHEDQAWIAMMEVMMDFVVTGWVGSEKPAWGQDSPND